MSLAGYPQADIPQDRIPATLVVTQNPVAQYPIQVKVNVWKMILPNNTEKEIPIPAIDLALANLYETFNEHNPEGAFYSFTYKQVGRYQVKAIKGSYRLYQFEGECFMRNFNNNLLELWEIWNPQIRNTAIDDMFAAQFLVKQPNFEACFTAQLKTQDNPGIATLCNRARQDPRKAPEQLLNQIPNDLYLYLKPMDSSLRICLMLKHSQNNYMTLNQLISRLIPNLSDLIDNLSNGARNNEPNIVLESIKHIKRDKTAQPDHFFLLCKTASMFYNRRLDYLVNMFSHTIQQPIILQVDDGISTPSDITINLNTRQIQYTFQSRPETLSGEITITGPGSGN